MGSSTSMCLLCVDLPVHMFVYLFTSHVSFPPNYLINYFSCIGIDHNILHRVVDFTYKLLYDVSCNLKLLFSII